MKKYVLYNEEQGIFLGGWMGLGFWTKLETGGQDAACTFASVKDGEDYIATWPADQRNKEYKLVQVEAIGRWATIQECVEAGLPSWIP
jgi:hypothetical protein